MSNDSEPGSAYWKLIDPIWYKVSFYDTWKVLQRGFSKISPKQKNLYAVHWADSEICNGGFDQFFDNSTGMLGPEAVEGYRAIGMPQCAELVNQACLMLGIPYPRERDERQKRLAILLASHPEGREIFAELEQQYYKIKYEESGGFDAAADRYAISD